MANVSIHLCLEKSFYGTTLTGWNFLRLSTY